MTPETINREGQNYYVIEVVDFVWENMVREGLISRESYIMRDAKIRGEKYPDDPEWQRLKDESTKAYKALEERSFELRNK
jgi:hypothetical protein